MKRNELSTARILELVDSSDSSFSASDSWRHGAGRANAAYMQERYKYPTFYGPPKFHIHTK